MQSKLITSFFRLTLTLGVILGGLASGASECDKLLDAESDSVEAGIGDFLNHQQRPHLKHHRLQQSLREMSAALAPVRAKAQEILRDEISYASGHMSRVQALQSAQQHRSTLAEYAQSLMAKTELTTADIHQLEAMQVLLARTRRLTEMSPAELAEQLEAEQLEAEELETKADQQSTTENSNSASESETPATDESRDKNSIAKPKPSAAKKDKYEDLKKALNRPKSQPKPKAQPTVDENPPAAKPEPTESEPAADTVLDKKPQAQETGSPKDEKQKPKGKEKGKKSKSENPAAEKSETDGEKDESQQTVESSSAGDPEVAQDEEAGEGEPKPGEAEQEGGQSSPEAGAPSPSPQESSADDAEPALHNNDGDLGENHVEGNDGANESQLSADQSILDDFAQLFKDRFQEFRKKLATAPEPGESSRVDDEPELDEAQSTNEKSSKSQAQSVLPPAKIERKKSANRAINESQKLTDTQASVVIQQLIRRLMGSALRNYLNSESFDTGMGHLQTTLNSISAEQRDDSIRQSANEVRAIRENLAAYQVTYKGLEQLGLSLLKTLEGGGQDSLRKVNFIHDLLLKLNEYSSLTEEEQRVLNLAQRILSSVRGGAEPSDRDFSLAFLSQLIGPLSKRVLIEKYKVEGFKEGLDYKAMATDIRAGLYNDLLVHSALAPYMKMLLNTSLKPKDKKIKTSERDSLNDQDPDLEIAGELDNFQRFYRDGSPTDIDLVRFVSGDMLEEVYHKEGVKSDPQTLYPKKVSFVLYDVSGSMGSEEKYVLRNALLLAYLDRSQKEVQAGQAEHIVYLMAFDGKPHEPERVAGLAQAASTFTRVRNSPMGASGDDSITGALVDVYRRIAEQQSVGGELNRANILLVTDAIAPVDFEAIEAARAKISPDVDVRLNAISMGDLNKDVQKLVALAGGEGQGKLGLVSHQHISYEEIQSLLNTEKKLEIVTSKTLAFDSQAQGGVQNQAVIDLKNKLILLEARRGSADNQKLSAMSQVERMIEEAGVTTAHTAVAEAFKTFKRLVLSNTSNGWSRATKLEALWAFANDLSRELKGTPEQVIASLTEVEKASLRQWLK